MIDTTFDSTANIITTTYNGKISAFEIIEYIGQLPGEAVEYSDLLYFEDQTKADFTFSPAEIRQIVHALFIKVRNLTAIRVAILNTHPKETAFSLIAIRLLQAKNVHAKVFSTQEAAMDWLLLHKSARKTI